MHRCTAELPQLWNARLALSDAKHWPAQRTRRDAQPNNPSTLCDTVWGWIGALPEALPQLQTGLLTSAAAEGDRVKQPHLEVHIIYIYMNEHEHELLLATSCRGLTDPDDWAHEPPAYSQGAETPGKPPLTYP